MAGEKEKPRENSKDKSAVPTAPNAKDRTSKDKLKVEDPFPKAPTKDQDRISDEAGSAGREERDRPSESSDRGRRAARSRAEDGGEDGGDPISSERPPAARPSGGRSGVRTRGGREESDDAITAAAPHAPPPTTDDMPLPSEENSLPGNIQRSTRRLDRPSSARPAPPRVKRAEDLGADPVREGSGTGVRGAPALPDDKDDEDMFVEVVAASAAAMEVPIDDDGNHGALLQKILDKKAQAAPGSAPVNEHARAAERAAVVKEIEQLRGIIQTLARSAHPLGKLMDYVLEDMDVMRKEMLLWRR